MGLDGVELVLNVEEHFGITIQDAPAARIWTVGDLVTLVHDRITAAQRAHCPMLPAFFALRTLVRDIAENEALRIRPAQAVAQKLSPAERHRLWERLPDLLGAPPPGLRRPPALRTLLGCLNLALFVLAVAVAIVIDLRTLPLTLVLAVLAIGCLHGLTLPLRTVPPQGWTTFGDVTRKIVGGSMATRRLHLQTRDEVFEELRSIIVETLGAGRDEVVPSARFAEDLGMG